MAGRKGHQDPDKLEEFNKYAEEIKLLRERGTPWEDIKKYVEIKNGGTTGLSVSTIRRYLLRYLAPDTEDEDSDPNPELTIEEATKIASDKWKAVLLNQCENIALVHAWAVTSEELPDDIRYDLLDLYVNKR